MYIFTRQRQADLNRVFDAIAFATDVAQLVTKITGVEVHTWTGVYGAPLGSLSWSCRAESLAALEAMNDQLNADASYIEKVAEGNGLLVGPIEDNVAEVLHTTGTFVPGAYTTIISAQCAPGRIGEAMAWAVEAQEASHKVTGLPGAVGRTLFGDFASVSWLTSLASIDEAQTADDAFKDADFGKMLDGAGGLFIPGATKSRLIRRLG